MLRLLPFLLLPCFIQGQTAPDTNDTLQTVFITATRLETNILTAPFSVTRIGSDWIRAGQPLLTLQEGLNTTPGVLATNADNFSQDLRISIRGFGSRSSFGIRGIRLLVDGLPETTTDGQGQVDNIDPGAVNSIEILRGAVAGLYGNASGGVIAFRTDDAPENAQFGLQTTIGSYGLQQYRVKGGNTWGKLGLNIHAAYTTFDGYRAQSAMRSLNSNAKLTFRPNQHTRYDLLFNFTNSPQADDAGGLTLAEAEANPHTARDRNITFDAGEALQQFKIGGTSRHERPHNHLLQTHIFGLTRQFENRLPLQSSGIVVFKRAFWGAGAAYTLPLSPHFRLRTQTEWESQRDDRQRYDNNNGVRGNLTVDQTEQFDNLGIGTQVDAQISSHWQGMAGLRYDWMHIGLRDHYANDGTDNADIHYNNINPLLGLTFSPKQSVNIFVNYATAFETPTLNEMANPNGRGGFNTDLQPQRSRSIEAGLKGRVNGRFAYEVSLFRIVANNEIAAYESDSLPGRIFYRNAGGSLRRGVELSTTCPIRQHFSMQLSYSYSDFRYKAAPNRSDDGNRLPGLPIHNGQIALQYMPEKGWFGVVQGQYTGALYANDANSVEIKPVTLLTARTGWRGHIRQIGVEVFAGSQNLTNTRYYANIRINAAANRYFEPGMGRMFYVGGRLEL